jgi:DNA-binding winged helix-turn-helix (wHTH) protein
MSGIAGAAGELRGPGAWSYPVDLLAGARGTLLTVIPADDGCSQMVIVGYLVPPPSSSSGPGLGPAQRRDLIIDRAQHRVLLKGRDAGLMFQEFELLLMLTEHPYRVFTREEILARAWGDRHQAVATRTVDVHVHRLRRKLGPVYGRYLVTVRRVGYMFQPPPAAARTEPEARPATPARRPDVRRR